MTDLSDDAKQFAGGKGTRKQGGKAGKSPRGQMRKRDMREINEKNGGGNSGQKKTSSRAQRKG